MARNFPSDFFAGDFNLKKYVYEKRVQGLSDRQIANSLGMGLGRLRASLNELGTPLEAMTEAVEEKKEEPKEEVRATVVDKKNKQTKVVKKEEPSETKNEIKKENVDYIE